MKLVDEIYPVVKTLLENEQREVAGWVLSKLVVDFPGHAAAHQTLAALAHAQGDMATAGEHFKVATGLAPDNAALQKEYGDFLFVNQSDSQGALRQYNKVLALDPRNVAVALTIAHIHVALRSFDEARGYYLKVMQIDPGHDEARRCLEKLASIGSAQTAVPAEMLAQARKLAEQGDKPAAIRLLSRLIDMEPRNALAHNDLGVLYFETGDKKLAQSHYERAAELAPEDIAILKNLGDFYYFAVHETEKAMRKYLQALTLDSEDVETLLAIAHLCRSIDKREDARCFLNRILEIEPWNSQARQLLTELDASQANGPEAMSVAELYAQAQALAADGDRLGAMAELRRVIATAPDHAGAYNDLGVMHYEAGDKEKALQYYEQAVRLDSGNSIYSKNLADFYYIEQGRIQEALKIYVRLLEAYREDVDCLVAAGRICADLKKVQDARFFLERALDIDPWNTNARETLRQIEFENPAAVAETDANRHHMRAAAGQGR